MKVLSKTFDVSVILSVVTPKYGRGTKRTNSQPSQGEKNH